MLAGNNSLIKSSNKKLGLVSDWTKNLMERESYNGILPVHLMHDKACNLP